MKRIKFLPVLLMALLFVLLSACASFGAANKAGRRIRKIPVEVEGLAFVGDGVVTKNGEKYALASVATKLIQGRTPDAYRNTTFYGQASAYYTVVYNRNSEKIEEEGCNIALFRFDYAKAKGKLLRDMKGTFPVRSYYMAAPEVLQYLDEDGGHCVLLENGALEIVSAETGELLWSRQVFGAKDYFEADRSPYSFREADMVCAFYAETVQLYRYAGTMYEVYTFESEVFAGLSARNFDTVDGILYAESGGEIVYAVDILTGEPRDLEEISVLVAEQRAQSEAAREQRDSLECDGVTYRVRGQSGAVVLSSEADGECVVDAAFLAERSSAMRQIETIYAEEYEEQKIEFEVDYVISDGRLFVAASGLLAQGVWLEWYTPLCVFELNPATGEAKWCGLHSARYLGGVRFLN